jgi:hypothetical protein
MDYITKIKCPNCGTALKSARGVRIGRKIVCAKCAIGFTVRAEDADQAEEAAGMNVGRLSIALLAALLYLVGGAGLAYYCFANNAPREQVSQASNPKSSVEDDAESPVPKAAAAPKNDAGALTSAEQRAIDIAIANGVWFLKDHTLPSGSWGDAIPGANVAGVSVGFASLPALTLLECGVPADDPVVQKAAALVRQQTVSGELPFSTYQRALAILFLDRLGDKKDQELIQYLSLCLIAGQHATQGAWHYDCPLLDRKLVPQLLKQLKDKKGSLDDWRKTALPGGAFDPGGWDNSNTQFAVLALWVAQRHGVSIDRTSALVEKHFRTTQLAKGPDPGLNKSLDGSWYYDQGGNSSAWPTMTCSGLLALAVGHGVTDLGHGKQAKPLDDPAIKRAFAMLAREIDRKDETRAPDFYFLWSLERVGVLFGLPKIGGKDWYAWGRKTLLATQNKDGSWTGGKYWGSNNILDTCFALLFLKQANLAKDLTNKLQLLAAAVTPSVQAPAKKD